jgi:PAS domain S-box-containing protein
MQKVSIYGVIIFRTLLCSFIAILLTGALLLWSKYSHLTMEFKQFRTNYVNLQKENIRQEIDATLSYIKHKQSHAYADVGARLEARVYKVYRIAWNLYLEHPDISATEFKKLLIDVVRPIRFFRDRADYFCIDDKGTVLLDPAYPEMEGVNSHQWQDAKGQIVIQDMLRLVNTQSEGFMQYDWKKPNINQSYPKYAFVKIFEPFNLLLGAGEYNDRIETDMQQEILETLSTKRFGKHGENYLFVLSAEGTMLASGAQPHLVGKDATQLTDANGKNFINDMIRLLKINPEGVFIDYVWEKTATPIGKSSATPKISFVKSVPGWDIIVGGGFYLDEIDDIVQQREHDSTTEFLWDILLTFLNFLGLMVVVYFLTRSIVKKTRTDFEQFINFFQRAATHSIAIDATHLYFIEFKILADAANQMLLNLKQTEEKFDLVIKAANAGIWDWHINDDDYMWWSPKLLELLGYQRDEVTSHFSTFMQWVHPHDQALVYRTTNAHLNQRVPYKIEFRVRHRSGEYRWFDATAQAKWDSQGTPLRMAGSLIDISERKYIQEELTRHHNELEQLVAERTQNLTILNHKLALEIAERNEAELALRYSEQRFRDVSDAAGEYIWEIDHNMCYAFVSERVEFVKGYQPRELLAHHPAEFMPAEDIEPVRIILEQALVTKTGFRLQHRNITKTGEIVWEEVNGVPVLDEAGQVIGFRGAGLSITERKRVEALLKQHSENLERLVKERTSELAQINEQLKTEIRERQQKAQQLRLAQFTVDNSPDAIEWINAAGNFVYVNTAECVALDYTQAELINMQVTDIDTNLLQQDWNNLWQTVQQQHTFTLETTHRRKDQSEFPVEIRGTLLQFDGNEYLCSFVRDITQNKQAEFAQLKRQQFSSILVGIQHSLLLAKFQIDYPRILELLGQITEIDHIYVLEGHPNDMQAEFTQVAEWYAATPISDSSMLAIKPQGARWLNLLQQGEIVVGLTQDFPADEQPVLHSRGILSLLILPILLNNQLFGLIGFEDCSRPRAWEQEEVDLLRTVAGAIGVWLERKQAEEALRDSEEVFSAIGSAAQDGIVMMDDAGKISYWNTAAERMFGYNKTQAIGKPLHILVSPERYLPSFKSSFHGFRSSGQGNVVGSTVELMGLNSEGREFPVEVSLSSVKLKGKWHALGIMRDITERKQAEAKLKQQNEALIHLNQEKNEFLGIAAHDLKNPLSSILGLAEEIQESFEELPKAEILEFTGMIQISAQRMFQLINNLLDVNAIEVGKMNVTLKMVNVLPILQSSILYYRKRAHEKRIYLDTGDIFGTQETFMAWVDAGTLHQVLDNLLSNGLKYSPTNKNLYLRLLKTAHSVRFEIQDEGPGLSVEDHQKLFSKFTRLTPRPTQGEHSTGLGLYIVKRLVEAMQGRVWCETVLGHGATFIVEFPSISEKSVTDENPSEYLPV